MVMLGGGLWWLVLVSGVGEWCWWVVVVGGGGTWWS